MRGRPALRLATCLVLLPLLVAPARGEEARTFQKMWGSLFNKLDPNRAEGGGGDGTLQSAVRSASEDLRSKAAELQGKLLARLKGGGRGDPSGDRDRGSRRWDAEEWLKPLNLTLSLLDQESLSSPDGSGGNDSDARHASGLLASLQQYLPHDLDPHRLAAIATLQGWALSALLKSQQQQQAQRQAQQAVGAQVAPLLQAATPVQEGLRVSRVWGEPVPQGLRVSRVWEPSWKGYQGRMCLRLSNFGDGDGYRPVYFGPDPCGSANGSSPTAEQMARFQWGADNSFLVDCGKDRDSAAQQQRGVAADRSALGGAVHAAAGWAAAGVTSSLQPGATACRLSVASDGGHALVLRHEFRQAEGAPHLAVAAQRINAVRLRLCNLAPSYVAHPASPAGVPGRITLSRLKLDGRELVPVVAASHGSPADASGGQCETQLYRLAGSAKPSWLHGAGFVLSGWVSLGADEAGAVGARPPGFGVGEMAAIEVGLGEYLGLF